MRLYFRCKPRGKQTFPKCDYCSGIRLTDILLTGKMKRPVLKMRDSLRGVIVLVVFAGLIFSCAEGIRLLPFPPPAASDAENASSHTDEFEHLSYVRCLDGNQTSFAFESRHAPVKLLSGYLAQAALDLLHPRRETRDAVLNINRIRFHTAPARILPETRGPPAFFAI